MSILSSTRAKQRSLSIAGRFGRSLYEALRLHLDDGQKRSLLVMAYVAAVRRLAEATDAGNDSEAEHERAAVFSIGKEIRLFDEKSAGKADN